MCGFDWEAVDPAEVPERVRTAGRFIAAVLAVDVDHAARPEPGRWSSVEYAAHVRDAAFNLRDRMILALAVDVPQPPSMHPALRVDAGLYAGETSEQLRHDIDSAAGVFSRFVEHLPGAAWQRQLVYPWPREAERSLAWVAAQVVHELEHHGQDIAANALGALDRVFHVAEPTDWGSGATELTGSTRGRTFQQEGFVHLATAAQLPGVLDRYYSDIRERVIVLEIDPGALPDPLQFDLVGDQVFAHLYSPLPRSAVRAARPATQ